MKILKFLILVMILFLPIASQAVESLHPYHPTYFIGGDKDNQVKWQISFKYGLLYPFNSGLFLGYTQIAKWNLYDLSSPFKEINYNPSIFWEKQNLWKLDFLRIIPYEHMSNGLDGDGSRSTERYFVESQISTGDFFNIGISEKVGGFYVNSRYRDYHYIWQYLGFFKTTLFIQIKDKHWYIGQERLAISGEWTKRYYWYQVDFSFRVFTSKFSPKIYVQYYRGYCEFLINYFEKSNALRAGFIFNN